jgi:maltose alpha-D-glucosyltransferase/alpha-amylase
MSGKNGAKPVYESLWYKDAIIYEVHIKAFYDSNQDGIGDLNGLMQKLDYLQELGVTAIWLLPFYPSPLRDDGYDIADYYNINPSFGNINDFKKLLAEAHRRGLKIITELVINHTSDQHAWFRRARKSPKDSDQRNFYVWSDDPNQYPDVRIIFQDFEKSNWTWDSEAQQYYWHRFFSHQPDLNYDSPLVQEEIFKIIDYWCDMGVDGFRLDAVPYLFERNGTNGENLPETHDYLKKLRRHIDTYYPGTLLLAEANMWPEDSAGYFGNGDECHMNYHFPLMPRMYMALQMEDRYPIIDIFDQTPSIPENCQWAIFLRNHDELTLEMVTDEERDYMYKVYVKDPKARINLGIRHRLAPLMANNRKKIELMNYLLFSMPGTPVIYYGDEIGMGDNFYLGDRDGVRTPMQWTPERNAGFSETNPQKLYLPVIQDPDYHYESVNVEMQNRNASSLLWWTKRMIARRKSYKAFARGDIKFIGADNSKILAFTRTCQDQTMLVVANLSRYSQPVKLELQEYEGVTLVEVFSKNKFPSVSKESSYFLSLGAYDCQWFSLENKSSSRASDAGLSRIRLNQWSDIVLEGTQRRLEQSILPAYITTMRWFGGKARVMENLHIVQYATISTANRETYLLLIEINYREGFSEYYQLPVAFCTDQEGASFKGKFSKSVIASLSINDETGFLYDAMYSKELQQFIIFSMSKNDVVAQKSGDLIKFNGNKKLTEFVEHNPTISSRVVSSEQSNTSFIYGNNFFCKLFRKLDFAINSEVEISKFLTEETDFRHTPAFIGSFEWIVAGQSMTLGVMQELIDNSNDGWTYVLDRLDELNEKILANPDVLKFSEQLAADDTDEENHAVRASIINNMFEGPLTEQVRLLAKRTGEMHIALSSCHDNEAFTPEAYSLHYQRSLYSGLKTLVRNNLQSQHENIKKLPPDVRPVAEKVVSMDKAILEVLKNIYVHKIETVKTRIHGDYHLGQVLFTGKDFVITDFEGEPGRSYTERRLKRSPLRDVAGMIRSFHYAAYASLFLDNNIRKEDYKKLIPIMELWYQHVSNLFLSSYLSTVQGTAFVPKNDEDLRTLLTTFLLEKAIYELNYELNNRPDWVIIPLQGILSIMEKEKRGDIEIGAPSHQVV